MIGRVARRLAPAGVLVGVALAGCDTVGSIDRTGGVAVVEEQTKEASGANISSLSEVIQRNPSDPAAYNTRGAAYARLARYADAINDFNKAVQVDPNYAAGLRQPGAGLPADQPQRRGARRFQPRHRGRPVLRAGLSRPRQPPAGAGQLPGRPRRPSQAIRLNPEAAEAFHARGLVHQRQGDHRAAMLDFDAAIDRNPFVASPYAARGQSLVATGQYDKAVEDLNAALNTDNRNADAWAWRGVAYEKQGNRKDAVESYQRATTLDSGNRLAREGLSRVQGGMASIFR